ncbi:putative reverse transcriptase zinc-binding domain-containing protein [Helianthus annuus]|nr:putative reverse transcriptase zinc-binding domain-containing protein [Helianthus annuus]
MKWCRWIPKKCNIFAWRAELDRIPTVEALRKRNIDVVFEGCVFVDALTELQTIFFSGCLVSAVVWQWVSK